MKERRSIFGKQVAGTRVCKLSRFAHFTTRKRLLVMATWHIVSTYDMRGLALDSLQSRHSEFPTSEDVNKTNLRVLRLFWEPGHSQLRADPTGGLLGREASRCHMAKHVMMAAARMKKMPEANLETKRLSPLCLCSDAQELPSMRSPPERT